MTQVKLVFVVNAPINPQSPGFKEGYSDFQNKRDRKFGLATTGYWQKLNDGRVNLGWYGEDAAYARDYVDGVCQAESDI